ncbi:RsmB/NOP family class I SAM-dependent RNA methyltransferase [Paenibacillus assamensis]|uniref:RsmB/NOP family class I SAM-dependent RNA methyltransferase n=1 Tax=Paenibacillus assamensis TaxID=311244 RepID=UPI00040C124E|nr:RsmF rRNA methyltransferase first C-terminal domain-containing protein [Paenibacillus assamensis]
MKTLPQMFIEQMQNRLGEEWESFLHSYHISPYAGLRVNTLKKSVEAWKEIAPMELTPIPWTKDGFYIDPSLRPGKHPYYHAGFYYIQEPSAMAPVELLEPQDGDYVLDLCAAPGGKSVQIASRIGQNGVLVTNDIHPDRTKALVRNMELYGVTRAVVLNEDPSRIADAFPQWFDRVLVDAPCSGEGMFRKDPDMVRAWEREPVTAYSAMQQEILDSAAKLVAPGGRLVYSTCTFSPEENEASIARFLTKYSDFRVRAVDLKHGMEAGRPEWARACMEEQGWEASDEAIEATAGTIRLWPHRVNGEGHYVAVLEREGERPARSAASLQQLTADAGAVRKLSHVSSRPKQKGKGKQTHKPDSRKDQMVRLPKGLRRPEREYIDTYAGWSKQQLLNDRYELNACIGSYAYDCPLPVESLLKLKVARPGLFLGTLKNGRFEPSHALALALQPSDMLRVLPLELEQQEVIAYLRGDTLTIDPERLCTVSDLGVKDRKGYVMITLENCPLGFGKWVDGILKNEYPAAWRWTT